MAFIISFTGPLSRIIHPKWIIVAGQLLVTIATLLLVFADAPDKYWSLVFPAFAIGSSGAMLCYTHTKFVIFAFVVDWPIHTLYSIAIFQTTPPIMAGIIGAMFNCALQLGSAVGLAAVTPIQASVERVHGGFYEYHGRAAVFWFLVGIVAVQTVGVLVFYRSQSMTNGSGSDNVQAGFSAALDAEKFASSGDSKDDPGDIEVDLATLRG
jgi:MFS family permease